MKTLILPLKTEYFQQIAAGEKMEEFRLDTAFWRKRLVGKEYGRIVLTRGYPPAEDHTRRLVRAWRGYTMRDITHPLFGDQPVRVFAIDVSEPLDG